jgi:hypothetical protein
MTTLLTAAVWCAGMTGARAQTTSTWITVEGGSWHTATNWSPAIVPNSGTNIADFSTLALASDLVVTRSNAFPELTIGGFIFGDTDGTPNRITVGAGDTFRRSFGPAGAEVSIHVVTGTAEIANRLAFNTSSGTRKTGPGTLVLSYNGNAYGTNGIILESGITEYGTNQAAVFNAGPIVFEGGALQYPFGASGVNLGAQVFVVNASGGTLILTNGTASYRPNSTDLIRGTGTLVVKGGGKLFLPFSQSTFAGMLSVREGAELHVGSSGAFLMPTGTVQLSQGGLFRLTGQLTSQVARLTGTGDVVQSTANPTLLVGDDGASPFSFEYLGTNSSSMSMIKTGTSTMVWSGTNAHFGTTTVGQGTMIANGQHIGSVGAYTVNPAATLGGTGTIRRTVTVSGILAPGSGGIGTLTASNVTWNAGDDWEFELGAAGASDRLASLGTFVKGTGAGFVFDVLDTGVAGVYTLVTWAASTTFVSGDFSAVNVQAGLTPSFSVNPNDLTLTLTASAIGPQLGVSPAGIDFGAREVGQTSELVFVVTNSGDAVMTGSASVTGSAPFSVVEGAAFTLNAGSTTNVVIEFAPLLPESYSDGVLFSTDGGVYTGSVAGVGYLLAEATNSAIVLTGGVVGVQFGLSSGALYRVQATTNLMDGAGWTDVTTMLTNRSGPTVSFVDTNSAALPRRTYRILSP